MTLLQSGRDLAGGASAARAGSALLANVAAGVGALVAAYATSPLAGFHREFDADRRKPAPQPALDRSALPPCVAAPLARPNDLLLKPEHVQHLVRALLSRGWSAAGVAALVQAAYEGDHGWGDRWRRSDARTRADFDVRVFAGLVRTGADTLVDFNCVSAQEKGLCPGTDCRYDLRRDRNRLEELAAS